MNNKMPLVMAICIVVVLTIIGVFCALALISNTDIGEKETAIPVESENVIKESKNTVEKTKKSDEKTKEPIKALKAPFEVVHHIDGLKITVTKITNDKVLKINVKYENNSGLPYDMGESLHKIVADGKQQEHDTTKRLEFLKYDDVLYEIEDGVNYESVLIFNKIDSDKFNLVFNVDYNDVRINNILVK